MYHFLVPLVVVDTGQPLSLEIPRSKAEAILTLLGIGFDLNGRFLDPDIIISRAVRTHAQHIPDGVIAAEFAQPPRYDAELKRFDELTVDHIRDGIWRLSCLARAAKRHNTHLLVTVCIT